MQTTHFTSITSFLTSVFLFFLPKIGKRKGIEKEVRFKMNFHVYLLWKVQNGFESLQIRFRSAVTAFFFFCSHFCSRLSRPSEFRSKTCRKNYFIYTIQQRETCRGHFFYHHARNDPRFSFFSTSLARRTQSNPSLPYSGFSIFHRRNMGERKLYDNRQAIISPAHIRR